MGRLRMRCSARPDRRLTAEDGALARSRGASENAGETFASAPVEEPAAGEGQEEGASPDGSGEVRDAPPAEVAEAPRPASREPAPPAPVVGGRAMLVVETEPAGVEVRVAEILLGTTPLERADLHEGRHPVTLSHPDYQTMRLEGQVLVADRVLRIERRLVPGTGAVTLRVEPRGAWVEHDGTAVGGGDTGDAGGSCRRGRWS